MTACEWQNNCNKRIDLEKDASDKRLNRDKFGLFMQCLCDSFILDMVFHIQIHSIPWTLKNRIMHPEYF